MPWIQLLLLSRDFDYRTFSSACSPGFTGIEEAAPLTEDVGVRPIVLLSEGKEHSWNDRLPPAWQPKAVSDAELVACIGEESSKLVETCEYSLTGLPPWTNFFYRYRYYAEATLLAAQNGDLVDTITIYGASPRSCPFTITHTQSAYGELVSSEDIRNALSDYVNGYIVRGFVAPDDRIEDLAFDGINLWAAGYYSDKIYKLDPATGEVLSSFDFNSPQGLAFDGTHLWVTDNWEIHRLDPTTGDVVSSFDTLTRVVGLAYDGEYMWCSELYEEIHKLDPASGAVVSSFDGPADSWPYGLAFDGTHLWLADWLYGKIYKLDPATGAVASSFDSPGPRDPKGLAFDGTHLWVAIDGLQGNDLIYKINRR